MYVQICGANVWDGGREGRKGGREEGRNDRQIDCWWIPKTEDISSRVDLRKTHTSGRAVTGVLSQSDTSQRKLCFDLMKICSYVWREAWFFEVYINLGTN